MLETQVLSRTDDEIRARVEVTDALKQPLGLVHGGVFATLADQLTATTTSRAISSHTSFLRPITGGHVNPSAPRPPRPARARPPAAVTAAARPPCGRWT